MKKFFHFLGTPLNLENLRQFEEAELDFKGKDREFFSWLLARYSMMIQPELDEEEIQEVINDYLKQKHLCVVNIHELAVLVQNTIYNPEIDTLH